MARLSVVVSVFLAALLAAPAAADAISRKRAQSIAVRTFRAQLDPETVRLYGLRRPLRAKQSVEVFTGKPRQTLRRRPLRRPAWIFWLDQAHGALFQHPSVLLLIDHRSGRIRLRKKLAWYPLIDGRRPPFLRARARAWTSGKPAPTAAQGSGYAIRPEHLRNDCLVAIGDRGNPSTPKDPVPDTGASGDLEAMEQFADKIGLPRVTSPASARGLERTVERAVTDGCKDVFIFLAGHGAPGRGFYRNGNDPPVRTNGFPAGVKVATRTIGTRENKSFKVVENEYVTPTDLERIVDAQRGKATFKIKIMSCFAGRFFFALSDKPNIRVLELSSRADEPSYEYLGSYQTVRDQQGRETKIQNDTPTRGISEFVDRNLTGLETWASSPQEAQRTNFDLAAGIARSFALGAHRDFAAKIGWTHPILVYK